MYRVLVVCTGNICRTPMAKSLLQAKVREENLEHVIAIDSAGLWAYPGDAVAENTLLVCAEHGLDVSTHQAKPIEPALVNQSDLILCMEEKHKHDLGAIFPHLKDRIFTLKEFAFPSHRQRLSIADPIGQGIQAYRRTFRLIEREIARIWPEIKKRALQKFHQQHKRTSRQSS